MRRDRRESLIFFQVAHSCRKEAIFYLGLLGRSHR